MNNLFLKDPSELSDKDARIVEDTHQRYQQIARDRIKDTLTDPEKLYGVLQDYPERIKDQLASLCIACYEFERRHHGSKLDSDEADIIASALIVFAALQCFAGVYISDDLPTLAEIAEDYEGMSP